MSEALSLFAIAAIVLAGWLLPRYLEARVTQAAKGAVDERVGKVLTEHRHELDKQLETHRSSLSREADAYRQGLTFQQTRYSQDYELFAARRNEVYAETYAALERTRGSFKPHFRLITVGPNFSGSTPSDLQSIARSEHVSEGEREELDGYIERQELDLARRFTENLHRNISLRQAHIEFRDFKNMRVLNALYYSPDIARLVDEAIGAASQMTILALDLDILDNADLKDKEKVVTELDAIAAQVRDAMRSEMQTGFGTDVE